MPFASIEQLDGMTETELARTLSPLFEGAPRYLAHLATERPFRSWDAFWRDAHRVALGMAEPDQIELLEAHPRLGALPGSVSAMSFVEQGYDREAADIAAEEERRRVDAELARLNDAYEAGFGFRYCTFVAGRPRGVLVPIFEAALGRTRDQELRRGLREVVEIAHDRWSKLRGEEA